MAPDCIVFSLANPTPEVDPEMAARHAAVVATGRSDLPNQINNVLAFPGVFRGAIDAGATAITDRKSTRLNSSHANISYAVFCLKKKKTHKSQIAERTLD